MAIHVSFGGDDEPERLRQMAKDPGLSDVWTMARRAELDDTVLFYIKGPLTSFVASGRVASPTKVDGEKYGWPGQLMSEVDDIVMLTEPVTLDDARTRLPEWGWLRLPRRNVTVPEEHEAALLRALSVQSSPKHQEEVRAMENVTRESRTLSRSRNRGLRDAVVDASSGTCSGCGYDFSSAVSAWRSLLQAHHLTPLHHESQPVVNSVKDLAALCPTCHVLVHLQSPLPTTPAALRDACKRP